MPNERLFNERDVQELIDKNSAPPLGRRNAALIMGGVYWGLTLYELSVLDTKDVVAESGALYRIWVLPEYNSYNGEVRECRTEDHVAPFFEGWIKLRIMEGWGLSKLSSYQGLDPNSKYFLNDRGEPYKLSERKKGTGQYQPQPQAMAEQFKRMIGRTSLYGARPTSFRDSFIKGMYEQGCKINELKKVTGIKQKRTLDNKIRPQEAELDEVFKKLFSRVKYPFMGE